MQLKSLLWAFAATSVLASAVPEDAEKRYYGPATVTKWATKYATKWATKYVTRTTTCTKWSKTRTVTKTVPKWSKTTTKWATKTSTKTKTVTAYKPGTTKTTTVTKLSTTTRVSTATLTETVTSCSSSPTNTGPVFAGCYKENPENAHILSQERLDQAGMTRKICQDNCFEKGFVFAGLTNGTVCACGEGFEDSWAETLLDDDCDSPCGGNEEESCGGEGNFEIYVKAQMPRQVGCYDDNGSRSVLSEAFYTNPEMTTDICHKTCFSQGFTFAALRSGNTCYCNDGFLAPPLTKATDDDCKVPCVGNPDGFDFCGGNGYLLVWALTN